MLFLLGFLRLNAPAVPAVTQVVFKNHSWAGITREVENPENPI
jgi:hypothetical protein